MSHGFPPRPSDQQIAVWLNSLRHLLARLHRLISGLNEEAQDGTNVIRTLHACDTLYALRILMETDPGVSFVGGAEIALLRAQRLVKDVRWPRDGDPQTPGGLNLSFELNEQLPITKTIAKYVASIDPRSLEDTLRLLSGVPQQDQVTATKVPQGANQKSEAAGPNATETRPPSRNGRNTRGDAQAVTIAAEPSDPTSRDWLGKLIHERYLAGADLKIIATQINGLSTWGKGWNNDRVRKELTRYCTRKQIKNPMRKPRRNRQD
jgi:hypothetical protein